MNGSFHEQVIAKRNAVERIAKRARYPDYKAEDIAQEAALQFLKNPNLVSQSRKHAFVDAIRGGIERTYDRRGEFVGPVFESEFEDYENFVNSFGCGLDLESKQDRASDLLDIVFALRTLPERSQVIFEEYYFEGHTLGEISERIGVSESRTMQILHASTEQIKEIVISKRISQQTQRRRKFEESQPISREIQERSRFQNEIENQLAKVSIFKGFIMESFTIPKIPKEIFRSF